MVELNPAFVEDMCFSPQDFRVMLASLVCEEGVRNFESLSVSENSPAGMSVLVTAGGGFVLCDNDTDNGGMYHIYSDSDKVLAIANNPGGSPRTDTIWAKVCDFEFTAATSEFELVVVQGSAIPPVDGCSYYLLATVVVPAGESTSITGSPTEFGATDGDITDERTQYGLCAGSSSGGDDVYVGNEPAKVGGANPPAGAAKLTKQGSQVISTTGGSGTVTFPDAFPNGVVTVVVTAGSNNPSNLMGYVITGCTVSGFTVYGKEPDGDPIANGNVRIEYIAYGW